MKRSLWPTRDSVKDYFPLPKEIFSLGLSAAEIAIYAYLLLCEAPLRSRRHWLFGISGKNSVISSYWRPVWAAGRMLQI